VGEENEMNGGGGRRKMRIKAMYDDHIFTRWQSN
jgi:hypothetical protein